MSVLMYLPDQLTIYPTHKSDRISSINFNCENYNGKLLKQGTAARHSKDGLYSYRKRDYYIKEITNCPKTGYKILGLDSKNLSKYDSVKSLEELYPDSELMVKTPDGHIFELSYANWKYLMTFAEVDKKGNIDTPLIYVVYNEGLELIPANSKRYEDATIMTSYLRKTKTLADLEVGRFYKFREDLHNLSQESGYFMGFETLDIGLGSSETDPLPMFMNESKTFFFTVPADFDVLSIAVIGKDLLDKELVEVYKKKFRASAYSSHFWKNLSNISSFVEVPYSQPTSVDPPKDARVGRIYKNNLRLEDDQVIFTSELISNDADGDNYTDNGNNPKFKYLDSLSYKIGDSSFTQMEHVLTPLIFKKRQKMSYFINRVIQDLFQSHEYMGELKNAGNSLRNYCAFSNLGEAFLIPGKIGDNVGDEYRGLLKKAEFFEDKFLDDYTTSQNSNGQEVKTFRGINNIVAYTTKDGFISTSLAEYAQLLGFSPSATINPVKFFTENMDSWYGKYRTWCSIMVLPVEY